ncbi:MAG: amidohydrolase family protein [Clostridia bacterium]|nr:amidohydrolase family protein [Clostridia bacterium]
MIIDAHTHIFPDKIADRSIKTLETIGKQAAVIGGREDDLLGAMKNSGIDKSIVMPVLTKPEQFESINRFAANINKSTKLISFAGIHPHCENINKLLNTIVEMGFKGVKLHPDYQQTDITDRGYAEIIDGCRRRGLKVMIHAGIDPAYPQHIHCPPELSSRVVRELTPKGSEPFIILAHMGGAESIEKVERLLVGLPVFFDTSFVLEKIDRTILHEIIRAHGYKRILFATDSPWRNAKEYLRIINSLNLNENEKKCILGANCAELLCL